MRTIGWSLLWVVISGLGLSACSIDRGSLRTAKLPDEPVRGALNSAIWNDIEHEIFLNGGGWSNFLRSDAEKELTVEIRDMRCRSSKRRQLCAFDLVRSGDRKPASDVEAPNGLRCTARFIYDDDDGWALLRLRPRKGEGHTRTSMECGSI